MRMVGSMYVFGGHDKDMYYNDIWRYQIPTFASDRSKWWELITLWERDITWLNFNNNRLLSQKELQCEFPYVVLLTSLPSRYNHDVLKDVYQQAHPPGLGQTID